MSAVRLLFFLCLYLLITAARSDDFRFQQFFVANGLSDGHVKVLMQDHNGYLWIGTHNGLNRYDGHQFQTFFSTPDDPHSLPSNNISSIAEDAAGNIWIGTADNGYARFDSQSQIFERHQLYSTPGARQINQLQWSDGLYAASGDGLFQLNRATPERIVGTEGHNVKSRVALGARHFLIIDDHVWQSFHGESPLPAVNFSPALAPLSSLKVTTLYRESDEVLLLGTDNGLFEFNLNKESLRERLMDWQPDATSVHRHVLSILRDRAGQLWIASLAGVLVRSNDDQHSTVMGVNPNDPYSLADDHPYAILEDREGLIWLGGLNGMSMHNPATRFFSLIRYQPGGIGLSQNTVMSILEDSTGQLWAGSYAGGLDRFNAAITQHDYIAVSYDVAARHDDIVLSMLEIPDGVLWAGLRRYGLNKIDIHSGAKTAIHPGNESSPLLSRAKVYRIAPGLDQNLWLATDLGLIRYNTVSNRSQLYPLATNDPGHRDETCLYTLLSDGQNGWWLGGCERAGLIHFNPASGQSEHWHYDPADPDSLSADSITSLFMTGAGKLMITTQGGGLNIFDPMSKTFAKLRLQDGLPVDTLWGILPEKDGVYWLSTNKGLVRYDEKSRRFLQFTADDGAQGDEYNLGSYYRNRAGHFYFGGVAGISHFTPTSLPAAPALTSPTFTGLRLRNRPAAFAEHSNRANNYHNLQLGYDDRLFGIEFSALSYSHPGTLKYSYRLLGLDENWIETDASERLASFSGLSPGHYELEARVRDGRHGDWSAPARLPIDIAAPWWRSWPAYCLYALIIPAIFYAIWRWRRARWAMQHAQLSAEQARQAKSDFLATITHELRTPLNGIIGALQLLQLGRLSTEQKENAGTASQAADELLQQIDDMLDYSKLETHKVILKNEVYDLPNLLYEVTESQRHRAEEKGLALELACDESIGQMWLGDQLRLRQILIQLIGNAIKFSLRGGVWITAKIDQNELHISVRDTGIGMEKSEQWQNFIPFQQGETGWNRRYGGKGLGLALCAELIALMQGRLAVNSILGTGSEFTVILPLTQTVAEPGTIPVSKSVDNAPSAPLSPRDPLTVFSAPQITVHAPQSQQPRILLVEDNDVNQKVARRMLEKLGCHVDVAVNGEMAISKVIEYKNYDCILMDCQMPIMDGFEASRQLRAMGLTTPIVAVTANTMSGDRERCLQAGMNDYVPKPISLAAMGKIIEQYASSARIVAH